MTRNTHKNVHNIYYKHDFRENHEFSKKERGHILFKCPWNVYLKYVEKKIT